MNHRGDDEALVEALGPASASHPRLLQAHKLEAIGQLAAGVAHEINTPTQYVTDNTEFLQRSFGKLLELVEAYRALGDAVKAGTGVAEAAARAEGAFAKAKVPFLAKQVPRALEQSIEGLGRISRIVSAMKDFSHPSDGQKAPVNLRDALSSTVVVCTNEWKYVAEMETRFDDALPPVPCMRDEINQVVLNLIVNAAHAIGAVTDEGAERLGKIVVETRLAGRFAEIRVTDDGGGIPEKIRGRVFDPFFTTKPVGKGTGQGLAIAYSVVVDQHGGTIDFETEEGKGTTFIVRLPLDPKVSP